MLFEALRRWAFELSTDRIGPDIPATHWRLRYRSTMLKLCIRKFRQFDPSADFRLGAYAVCTKNISLGARVVVRPGSMLFADDQATITIQDHVMLGPGVHFYVNNHKFDRRDIPLIDQGYYPSASIVVEEGAWVGANSIVLPGVTIGKNAVIGAGSVVTKSVPPFSVAVGAPAKVIRTIGSK